MKNIIIGVINSVALIAGMTVSPGALASNTADVNKVLAGSTALELPAKAADLVANAAVADKKDVTIAAVKAGVGVNPSAAVAIVSAVARKNPAMAPVAAVTAVTLQHKRIDLITKAAAVAAPSEAAKIVTALIKEFPNDYAVIAVAAAEGAPSAGREILAVVADYVPSLQPGIRRATAKFAANEGNVPVQAVLSQSYNQYLTSSTSTSIQAATSLGQYYNQGLVSGVLPSAGTSATLALTTPGTTPPPSLSPPPRNPPVTPPPGPITIIGPGQIPPQQPGGNNYSSP